MHRVGWPRTRTHARPAAAEAAAAAAATAATATAGSLACPRDGLCISPRWCCAKPPLPPPSLLVVHMAARHVQHCCGGRYSVVGGIYQLQGVPTDEPGFPPCSLTFVANCTEHQVASAPCHSLCPSVYSVTDTDNPSTLIHSSALNYPNNSSKFENTSESTDKNTAAH